MIPPQEVPAELYSRYSMDGAVSISYKYMNNSKRKTITHAKRHVANLIAQANRREPKYYGVTDTYLWKAFEAYPIKGKQVAIFGSQVPWYEANCLAFGATSCVVFEYMPVISEDPRIVGRTYQEQQANPRQFDVGLSISSFEHDGLGRYGDPIDPDGDLKAMTNAKSIIKKGGLLYLAVPVGHDHITWNCHRIYGKARLPLLVKNWKFVKSFGFPTELPQQDIQFTQPVFVLQNGG